MHAASRDALKNVTESLTGILGEGGQLVARASQAGSELFDVANFLDRNRDVRVALGDQAAPVEQRLQLVRQLFGGKISDAAMAILEKVAGSNWSTTGELRQGIVTVARRALLQSAQSQDQLATVEDELFRLSRLLESEPKLTRLLADANTDADRRRGLLAQVLYGKVTAVTEALALQVIDRPEKNPIEDMASLAGEAAQAAHKAIATVTTAQELSDQQRESLAGKLQAIYGTDVSIHTEVDPSLLGGMIIRVGDEVIDGSTAGKLQKLRVALA